MSGTETGRLVRHEIGGVAVAELAREFGTPTYVYDEQVIRQRVEECRAFDVIRFAQKACSNLAVLDLVRRLGVLVDAVSAGEIHRALRAGFQPQGNPAPIVYTADIFDRDSLQLCRELGLHINVGSPDMIDQWGAVAPGSNITLRVNPGFGHGHSRKTNTGGDQSKHGIWHEQIHDCLLRADRNGLGVTGVHMHIGSGSDLEHLAQVCGAMEAIVAEIGRTVTTISAGGGISTPYRPGDQRADLNAYYQLWNASRQRIADQLGHPVRLELEPGRYLVAESGYLITEIRAIKKMGENVFYLVDAGFNALARPILYGAYHPMSIAPADGHDPATGVHPVVVGGPLCESGDIFTQEEGGFVSSRELPGAKVGDFLVLECAGAYGFVMASNYNSKPLPAEVLVREGRPLLVRRRQSPEDLIAGEIIPA